MFKSLTSVTYPVADLEQAGQWYRAVLGQEPVLDSPFVVSFDVGEAALNLVAVDQPSAAHEERVVVYWRVDDIDLAYRRLLELGAVPHTEISTRLNVRLAKIIDPFGNVIGLTDKLSEAKQITVEDQPSESAMTVAFCRALAAKDEREAIRGGDDLAELFLPEDRRRLLKDCTSREWIIKNLVTPELYGYFLARTAYIDDIFTQALRENIPQIVLLGAGYDSRAYRFQTLINDTRIFELDIRPTQQRKLTLLAQAHISIPEQVTLVPINFKTEAIAAALSKAGFDRQQRTLFIWEGVTYYLPAETVNETLGFVTSNAPDGSILCFDYMTQPVPSTYTAEPFQFWLEPEKIEPFLAERGYLITDYLTPEDMECKYLTLRDGSSAGKVLPFFCLVQAVVRG